MKFDENRVYTALNADKLKVGSKVIVADNLASLKKKVAAFYDENAIAYITEVCDIISENCENRFKIVERYDGRFFYGYYGLAYLISESNTNSGDFEIKQAYHKGVNDMYIFCQEWFKEHKSLPGLVEVDLHLFWHKFHEKFDC